MNGLQVLIEKTIDIYLSYPRVQCIEQQITFLYTTKRTIL